jgi:hypothetical protein
MARVDEYGMDEVSSVSRPAADTYNVSLALVGERAILGFFRVRWQEPDVKIEFSLSDCKVNPVSRSYGERVLAAAHPGIHPFRARWEIGSRVFEGRLYDHGGQRYFEDERKGTRFFPAEGCDPVKRILEARPICLVSSQLLILLDSQSVGGSVFYPFYWSQPKDDKRYLMFRVSPPADMKVPDDVLREQLVGCAISELGDLAAQLSEDAGASTSDVDAAVGSILRTQLALFDDGCRGNLPSETRW